MSLPYFVALTVDFLIALLTIARRHFARKTRTIYTPRTYLHCLTTRRFAPTRFSHWRGAAIYRHEMYSTRITRKEYMPEESRSLYLLYIESHHRDATGHTAATLSAFDVIYTILHFNKWHGIDAVFGFHELLLFSAMMNRALLSRFMMRQQMRRRLRFMIYADEWHFMILPGCIRMRLFVLRRGACVSSYHWYAQRDSS